MTAREPARRLVCIGRIVGVLGIAGWIRVVSYTRIRTDIFTYRRWTIGEELQTRCFELESGREQGRGLVAKLRGLDDRETAAGLVGMSIYVAPEELPALEAGEYFWHQLEGLKVSTLDGTELGIVDHLLETGANDVLVVSGERERLIPYIPEVIRDVDLGAGIIRVDWDAGF